MFKLVLLIKQLAEIRTARIKNNLEIYLDRRLTVSMSFM